jgi:uncharacterized iron-regulated membrane protein
MLKTFRTIHKWIGLVLALPLILQCITGFILAVDPFLDSSGAAIDPAKLPVLFAAAQAAVPDGFLPRRYQDAGTAGTLVDFADPRTQQIMTEVALDTLTQHVRGTHVVNRGLYGFAHGLHETLLLGPSGRSLIGWSGLGLFALGVTGIPIWWPSPKRWKAALTVSKRARGWRLFRELHGACGAWILALLLLQSLSGASMAFPQTARLLLRLPPQHNGGRHARTQDTQDAPDLDLAAVMASATQAAPGSSIRQIRFSPDGGASLNVLMLPRGALAGAPLINVAINGESGHVLNVQDPAKSGWGGWILGWMRALHAGGGLGFAWRLVICALALVMPLLPVTGVLMWLRRGPRRVAANAREIEVC